MLETGGATRNRIRDLQNKGSAFTLSSDHWTGKMCKLQVTPCHNCRSLTRFSTYMHHPTHRRSQSSHRHACHSGAKRSRALPHQSALPAACSPCEPGNCHIACRSYWTGDAIRLRGGRRFTVHLDSQCGPQSSASVLQCPRHAEETFPLPGCFES